MFAAAKVSATVAVVALTKTLDRRWPKNGPAPDSRHSWDFWDFFGRARPSSKGQKQWPKSLAVDKSFNMARALISWWPRNNCSPTSGPRKHLAL